MGVGASSRQQHRKILSLRERACIYISRAVFTHLSRTLLLIHWHAVRFALRFYRDLLGFRVVGESLNYGAEQDHLNHVFGSKVHITSLGSPAGPGIEFLEYLTPHDGRPSPTDTKANDLWSSQTTLIGREFPASVQELLKRKVEFISPEPQQTMPLGEKDARGVLIRDPDGHFILFQSESDHARQN
jgi:catechol 2,3-dioxygenase-like lactoylglutathione lyase family enzyme